ncbi:MAG: efflux RND transporter periplasmic adaptor subunit [Aureliella sp.]
MASELRKQLSAPERSAIEAQAERHAAGPAAHPDHPVVLHAPVGGKKRSPIARWFVWLVQVAIAVAAGYGLATARSEPDTRIELPPAAADQGSASADGSAVPVTIAPVTTRKIERAIDAVGNLHGYDELTIKTKVSGRVARILHDFADRVEPGELLMEIDPTDAQLAVEQAKRSLNSELAKWGFQAVPQANADLTQLPTVVSAKLRADWSKSQLARLVALQNRGSASAEELEQAKTNAMVAESDYANQLLLARSGAATAQLKKAELDIAEQQLRETKIYVPELAGEDGQPAPRYTITDRYVTEGGWLATGGELFRLVIDDTLKLRLSIPEKHAPEVRVGQKVEVSTLTDSQPALGTVARVGPAVDPQTRTFQIEAEVPNDKGTLKTGSFAKARVIVNADSTGQTVPVAALVTFAGVHKVFVLEGDTVKEVQVELGIQTPQWVEIVKPQLAPEAIVVVSGQSQLADGSKVRVRKGDDRPESTESGETQ